MQNCKESIKNLPLKQAKLHEMWLEHSFRQNSLRFGAWTSDLVAILDEFKVDGNLLETWKKEIFSFVFDPYPFSYLNVKGIFR